MDTHESTTTPSPAAMGSKTLSRYSDTDSLFVKVEAPVTGSKPPVIPLVRFQQLEQEIRHAPAVAGPYEELATIYLQTERWTDARRVLDAGIKNCPEHEPIVRMHEDLQLTLATQLLDAAKKEAAQSPSDKARYDLEQAEINLLNERIRVCRDRFARHPDQTEILITLGIALRQSKRFEEAIEVLQVASRELALRARASLQMAMSYQSLGKPLDALSQFRRAALFRSPPPDPKVAMTALELASKLAEEVGLIDSAIYYLSELAKQAPKDSVAIEKKIDTLRTLLPVPPQPSPSSATRRE
ncbi:Tetratricopeptide repeat protein [Pirellula sp. SH-Sr6A]|uniref:tetratricopeptide repeat protein n=1 Tax=Pirellula sp. SH-Sr6A TaxID=1632865 RepID=UPI00078EDD69|nr:tetratricopeptide repeat protein [Pirellula sp. SH-Sr6A]AMV35532.1 Tetratricopeptide repeat protein [Pirellula sp. SH-Sr6A]